MGRHQEAKQVPSGNSVLTQITWVTCDFVEEKMQQRKDRVWTGLGVAVTTQLKTSWPGRI